MVVVEECATVRLRFLSFYHGGGSAGEMPDLLSRAVHHHAATVVIVAVAKRRGAVGTTLVTSARRTLSACAGRRGEVSSDH